MSVTNTGTTEAGAGILTSVASATAQVIFPPPSEITLPSGVKIEPCLSFVCRERPGFYIVVNVSLDQVFKLDYQYTPDKGANWYIGNQVASAVVTVDGGLAGFVNLASLNFAVGYEWRVQIYQSSGVAANGAYEYRYYSDNG